MLSSVGIYPPLQSEQLLCKIWSGADLDRQFTDIENHSSYSVLCCVVLCCGVVWCGGLNMLGPREVALLGDVTFERRQSHVGGSASPWGRDLKRCLVQKSQFLLAAVRSICSTLSNSDTVSA